MLVDKARFPRDKCCGDGLTTGALRRYEALGLGPEDVPSWQVVEDVVVRSPSGRSVTFPLPRTGGVFAVVARRAELDAAFLDVARAAGVKVHDGHGVVGASVLDDRVVLDVDGMGSLEARYVVAADGMWSPLRKLLGAGDEPGYRGEWHAIRQYFSGVTGPAARELFVWFDPDLLPGYAWSFPLPGGRANVGFGILRGAKIAVGDMGRVWPELLRRPHVVEALGPSVIPEAPHMAWPIPARIESATLHAGGGRVLFVGDAARATDPMTGEGIGQALETGELAAWALLAAGPNAPMRAADRYRSAVDATLSVDNRLAALLSRALKHRKGARFAVRLAGSSDWTRRNFARWLFEDYPRAILATPWRWRRRMLTGDGAFR